MQGPTHGVVCFKRTIIFLFPLHMLTLPRAPRVLEESESLVTETSHATQESPQGTGDTASPGARPGLCCWGTASPLLTEDGDREAAMGSGHSAAPQRHYSRSRNYSLPPSRSWKTSLAVQPITFSSCHSAVLGTLHSRLSLKATETGLFIWVHPVRLIRDQSTEHPPLAAESPLPGDS